MRMEKKERVILHGDAARRGPIQGGGDGTAGQTGSPYSLSLRLPWKALLDPCSSCCPPPPWITYACLGSSGQSQNTEVTPANLICFSLVHSDWKLCLRVCEAGYHQGCGLPLSCSAAGEQDGTPHTHEPLPPPSKPHPSEGYCTGHWPYLAK